MEYIVSARKYRPLTFDAVVGQTALTTTLRNAVRSGKLAHAYLFCGPRGVGKTTCARIFARAINCQSPKPDGEACGECESCSSFREQRSYNIFELDAASNNSVDDIKTLMEQTRIPPQVGRYKVFIIDEVHMLSTAAFNAFLKTLEEPPAHVVFILATTEKHKLLPTIISRCQIYDFERMTVQNTIDHLKMVAGREGVTYEEDALAVIAEKADGGMRDALSIFDQVASFCQGQITYAKAIEDLNVLDSENYFRIVDLSLENKAGDIMLLLNDVIAKGFDCGNLCLGLASHIRNVMMAREPQTMQLLEVSAQHKARLVEQAKKCPPEFLFSALKLLNQCDVNYRQSSNKRLLVELTLIQVAQLTQSDDDAPASGRSPKRLKSLFKNTVRQALATEAAQQVAAPKTVADKAAQQVPTNDTAPHIVSEPLSTEQAPSKKPSGKPFAAAVKLQQLGFTFGLTRKKAVGNGSGDEPKDGANTDKTKDKQFTQDELELEWYSMCNRMQLSPDWKGLAVRMKNIHPKLKGPATVPDKEATEVEIVIENANLLDEVKRIEPRILSTLRNNLKSSGLNLLIRQAEPEEVKPLLTRRERIELLRRENPAVNELFNRLELELA